MSLRNRHGFSHVSIAFLWKPGGSSFKVMSYIINLSVSKKAKLARKWFMKVKKTFYKECVRVWNRSPLRRILVTWCLLGFRREQTCGSQLGIGQLTSEKSAIRRKSGLASACLITNEIGSEARRPITNITTPVT